MDFLENRRREMIRDLMEICGWDSSEIIEAFDFDGEGVREIEREGR